MNEALKQPVTGVSPPQLGEAMIREVWPSVTAFPAVAGLGRALILSFAAAPLGWALMLPFYFLKILPFVARRYTLTNRRIMVQRGLRPAPTEMVELGKIDDVRILPRNATDEFFRAGDIEVVSGGQVVLTLRGVPEPDSFRHAILNSTTAWAPGKVKGPFVPAKAAP